MIFKWISFGRAKSKISNQTEKIADKPYFRIIISDNQAFVVAKYSKHQTHRNSQNQFLSKKIPVQDISFSKRPTLLIVRQVFSQRQTGIKNLLYGYYY